MRAADDFSRDYYDCTLCSAFASYPRGGKLVAKKDPFIGKRYEYVCNKHP